MRQNVPVIEVLHLNPVGSYMFKVNNRNTRTKCEICSKLTIKSPERRDLSRIPDAYLEPCQISKMERFAKNI